MLDLYQTITGKSTGIYKEKGSKFIAIAFPISSEIDFKASLMDLKKEFHDARHHCYAFRLGADLKEFRFSDDGEPNNSAGKPIFGQIQSFKLTHIAIVVVRYFGGTKLGVGGLVTAYREAAKEALNQATIVSKTVDNVYEIQFGYAIMSDVMNLIKKNDLEVTSQILKEKGTIQFRIRQADADNIIDQLTNITGLEVEFLKTI